MTEKKLQSFKDLNVWQKSADLATLVYKITKKFPKSELYGLINQMRRSAVSISSNIAEGFKRNHKKEKLQFYNVAYGSVAELESQIEISFKLDYLTKQDYQELLSSTIEVAKMTDGLMKSVRKHLNPKFYILIPFIFLYSVFYILTPSFASAAVLSLQASQNVYYKNDIFITKVWLDTEGKEINAGEIYLKIPLDILRVEDISTADSVFTLWIEEPVINEEGVISFIGGKPNGFSGKEVIGNVILKAIEEGKTEFKFQDSSRVFLNDGKGTPAKLATKEMVFNILTAERETPRDEWQKILQEDVIPPEPFKIEIGQDSSIFEGKYFIIFSTQDKETGIDHYEILETKNNQQGNWKTGGSPYLLEDQSLQSVIKVKAVDKAGNERIETLLPKPKLNWPIFIWSILILINIGAIIFLLVKSRSKTKI